MAHKTHVFVAILSFITGVLLTWGYFMYGDNKALQLPVSSQNSLVSTPQNTNTSLAATAARAQQDEHTQRITALQQTLQVTIEKLNATEQQLKQAQLQQSDFALQLGQQYEVEAVNAQWSYELETAITDFLITADYSYVVQLQYLTCKQTVCKFALVSGQDPNPDTLQWRKLYDELSATSWWQQFKLISSSSTDQYIEFVVSTKQ